MTPSMKSRRRWLPLVPVMIVASLTLVGCGGGDSQPEPLPPVASSPSSTTDPSSNPGTWRNKYTAAQLTAYDQAVTRLSDYETQSEPIWAAGQATPAAQKLFKKYFPSPIWETYYSRLEGYQQVDVKLQGLPTVLWSRANAIGSDSNAVTLLQCVDYSQTTATQHGVTAPKDPVYSRPLMRTVEVDHPDGYSWLIYDLGEPTPKNHTNCTATTS